uniref:Uncharacterized protein n=1 Tax=mine drainage metagenome TaxID=410659 RepID=E6PXZ1_9ZZZZ
MSAASTLPTRNFSSGEIVTLPGRFFSVTFSPAIGNSDFVVGILVAVITAIVWVSSSNLW